MTSPSSISTQNSLESKVSNDNVDAKLGSPPLSYPFSSHATPEHWAAIDDLPFLNAVIRETLRFCPPVHSTIRVATANDQIPISHPIVLQDGTVVEKDGYISIRKGSYIHIPIEGLNLSEEIWGCDAREFKYVHLSYSCFIRYDSNSYSPDRWANLPPKAQSPAHPGLGNSMSFGLGPHSCLGYKFTIAEIKVFLSAIVPRFVFTPAEGVEITKFNSILTRPYIRDKGELGSGLPVVVGKYRR